MSKAIERDEASSASFGLDATGPRAPGKGSAGSRVSSGPSPSPWAHRFPLGAVFVLALLAYSDSFSGGFVFDDLQQVRDNLQIRDLGVFASWSGYLSARHRWVGYLTFAVNYALGKGEVFDYHLVNFLIHAVNAGLVYALVLLAFQTPRLRSSALAASSQAIAFFATALFATHPLQTQAVTYIVQRFTSLSALFYLLTVVLFLRWRLHREAGDTNWATRAALYAGLLLAAVLGMKTKETAFTVPLAVLLCEFSFFEPLAWRRRLFLLPIASTMLVIPLTFLSYLPASAAALGEATRLQTTVSRLDYLLTQGPVVLTYLRLLVWPTGQNLDHDFPVVHRLLEPGVLGALLALSAPLALASFLYRRTAPGRAQGTVDTGARLIAFGITWFFLALSVESSVIPIVDVMYEHRVYLPSVGIFVGAAALLGLLFQRVHARGAARAIVVTAVILSVVLAVATFRRNRVWASDISLWSDAAQKSPGKSRPHLNLGTALGATGRFDDAAHELRRAVEVDSTSSYARAQLGATLLALGQPAEAEPELREAVRLEPRDPEALFNLGMVLLRTGRANDAKPFMKRFLEVAPPVYAAARRQAEHALR